MRPLSHYKGWLLILILTTAISKVQVPMKQYLDQCLINCITTSASQADSENETAQEEETRLGKGPQREGKNWRPVDQVAQEGPGNRQVGSQARYRAASRKQQRIDFLTETIFGGGCLVLVLFYFVFVLSKSDFQSWREWNTLVILALMRMRQEDHFEFRAIQTTKSVHGQSQKWKIKKK